MTTYSLPQTISIHAPLAGRDCRREIRVPQKCVFQSTRPSRGATRGGCVHIHPRQEKISIHAPLAGRDLATACLLICSSYFNPRAPRGARRPGDAVKSHGPKDFNPRAPRGARQQMCTKITYIFALTHKRNTFSCQTPSVRALSKKLSGRFSHKIRCEPPCKTMCAAAPHYTISVPSGRYVCLQPKCSILLSYFFPK